MTRRCLSDVASEYAHRIYDEYLDEVYGIDSCSLDCRYDDKKDYKLEIDLLRSGMSVEGAAAAEIDLGLLGDIKKIAKISIVYNNTYVTNNYTASTSGSGYVHHQPTPSATWTIDNPLGIYPNITIVDTNGQRISGQINYNNSTSAVITVTFNSPVAGRAYLS